MEPSSNSVLLQEALGLHRQGRLDEAVSRYRQVLGREPANAEAHYHLAMASCEQGRLAEGAELVQKALALDPKQARAHRLLGLALTHLGRPVEALASFDRAIALAPDMAPAFGGRADVLVALKRLDEAVASYDRALALVPNSVEDWCNRGAALHELKRYDEAIASYDEVIARQPAFAEAHFNRGNALAQMRHLDDAVASYDKALAINPQHGGSLNNRGNVLRELARHSEALASFDRLLAAAPNHLDALYNRALTLASLSRHQEALAGADKALALRPDHANAIHLRGKCLAALGSHAEAIASYERAMECGHKSAIGTLALACLSTCQWDKAERLRNTIDQHIDDSRSIISPFVLLGYGVSPARQLKSISHFVEHEIAPRRRGPDRPRSDYRHQKIRLAYLSADFNAHPVAYLSAGLIEGHDRSRFDVIGVSIGPNDKSDIRARLIRAFDQFHDVRGKSDADVAGMLNAMEIDIVVDLTGYTELARPGILACRAAPVQVTYLGCPVTMAADFADYVIADRFVLPFSQEPFYREKIVHLPDTFMVTDSKRVAGRTPTRSEAGLPERGFVFCCFNESYKIRPPLFDIWMRLLRSVEGGALWLMRCNDPAMANLRREAQVRGVDPARLIFAPKLKVEDHLARLALADLFLDTRPVNAGATAIDALWGGVPLLTCPGDQFVGRVALSLINAMGMPELATETLDAYEVLARKLAVDPSRLQALRQQLADNRTRQPLFNTDRFRRHIEAAYTTMWEAAQRRENPRSFAVPPIA